MSHKAAKVQRKEEKQNDIDFNLRRDAFNKEMTAMSARYRIDLVPLIRWTPQGAIPVIAFVDMKKQYENLTPEAKAVMEAGKNPAPLINEGDAPKLEV